MRMKEIAEAYDREQAKEIKRSIFKGRKCAYDKDEMVDALKQQDLPSPVKNDREISPNAHLRFLQN